jgi:hypothetical protein
MVNVAAAMYDYGCVASWKVRNRSYTIADDLLVANGGHYHKMVTARITVVGHAMLLPMYGLFSHYLASNANTSNNKASTSATASPLQQQ